MDWIEQEANKVHLLDETELKQSVEDDLSKLGRNSGDVSSPTSRSTSSHGFGSVSEAVSRRYSAVTADDEFMSALSAVPSEEGSRRPSMGPII